MGINRQRSNPKPRPLDRSEYRPASSASGNENTLVIATEDGFGTKGFGVMITYGVINKRSTNTNKAERIGRWIADGCRGELA